MSFQGKLGVMLLSGLLLLSACQSNLTPLLATASAWIEQTLLEAPRNTEVSVASPAGSVEVTFSLVEGVPYYAVRRGAQDVLLPSRLGFRFKETAPLNADLMLVESTTTTFDETWTQPWGEVREIRNHYNELRVTVQESGDQARTLILVFRVYDDGIGFRYELPRQPQLTDIEIMDEETEFVFADNHQSWWIPAYRGNRYEYLYKTSPLSFLTTSEEFNTVHTPLTLETADGLYLSVHEAALVDYASMTLRGAGQTTLQCDLVPWSDGVKVKGETPLRTPWRTLQIAERPGDLLTSSLILNLNEPSVLEDTSWIDSGKYVGIWWGMHISRYTWEPGYKHGATTENAERYIDFAARSGIDRVLIEGWNVGWAGDWPKDGNVFDFTTATEDFDIAAVTRYAARRGVELIGHHETSGAISNYERQMADAFAFYKALGVDAVKTGYVSQGANIERRDAAGNVVGLEWQHGQFMVEHYQRVVETAALHKIMLNVHEPIKPTGLRRTYPNLMTSEGARGQEYNAWGGDSGNPPEHTTILPFTRMLAGPLDFTPGIFDLRFSSPIPENRVKTTLAKQLALYVVLYSPWQMAADLPVNYVNQPAFQFIQDVPVNWGETQVLHAQIGDFITVVRRERDGDAWYLGSITDEESRTLSTPLSFLEPGRAYVAEIYADASDADWASNPQAVDLRAGIVSRSTVIDLELAPGGGQAIRFRPLTMEDLGRVPLYTSDQLSD